MALPDTDCRSHSITLFLCCQASVRRRKSIGMELHFRCALQTRLYHALAWKVHAGRIAALQMMVATNSSGGGALWMNFVRKRICASQLKVTVVHSLLAGRLFMASWTVSSIAWSTLRLSRAWKAASLFSWLMVSCTGGGSAGAPD
jgi:hypothetical protein